MAKKIAGQLQAAGARGLGDGRPSPPIGPALGQRGINIMEFCKAFNAQTQEAEKGSPIPVVITYYQDKSFTFAMKDPARQLLPPRRLAESEVGFQGARQVGGGRQDLPADKVREIRRSQDEGSQRQ